jgi:hypothetical protein
MTLSFEGIEIFENLPEEEIIKWLYNLYISGVSTRDLAKKLDTTDVTIRKYFIKYNLKLKSHGGQYKGKQIKITEKEYRQYTTKELMLKYNCSQFTLYNLTKGYKSRVGRTKKYYKKSKKINHFD